MSSGKKPTQLAAIVLATGCLSACGGGTRKAAPKPPAFPRAVAADLAAASDAVAAALAAGDSCRALTLAHRLQTSTIAAINERRVPSALQEQLTSSVNGLVARVRCVPAQQPTAPVHDRGKHKGEKKHGKKPEGGD